MRTWTLYVSLACAALAGRAEQKSLTLKQAVDLALMQNPDLLLARLDEQKAGLEVQAVREPLLPRVVVGSGLAYSSGMPMSIEGSTPAVVQAKAVRNLWDPQQGYQVAQARESARAASLATAGMREEVALRVASIFLDLERAGKRLETARRQVEHLRRAEAAVRLRVDEGRELPIEGKRAALAVARARSRAGAAESERNALARSLAAALGLAPGDEVAPVEEERNLQAPEEPTAAAIEAALKEDPEIRRLESELAAKNFEVRGIRAARLPKVDLVAQYGLLAKFNHYEDYFKGFQRHNGQLGASIQIPIFASSADEARAAQAEIEARRIRAQIAQARSRFENDLKKGWEKLHGAEAARELARLELDVAREQVTVLLAQMEEGRATMRQVEEARFQEQERWLQLSEAGYQLEVARLELLRRTNTLLAALK
jgi:outer membrane protein TolC